MDYKKSFPTIETCLQLEPEELAPFILRCLDGQQNINRYNFTQNSDRELREYAGNYVDEFCEQLMEAWMWLEKELMVIPKPGQRDDWMFITRKGRKILKDQNFDSYRKDALLPSEGLDAILIKKVRPLFVRGEYETSIFLAFKEVEVRVRKLGNLPDGLLGVSLMRKAFDPENGILVDTSADGGERKAKADFFAGAIGLFKNPSSHRDVCFTDPKEVSDIIHIANQLLRMLPKINQD